MKKLYIDQIARRITDRKYATKTYYNSDIDQATASLEWFISYLEKTLATCLQLEDGRCTMEWKHESCQSIYKMIQDLKE